MNSISNIVKGFVAMAALAILAVGCEQHDWEPNDNGDAQQTVKGSGTLDWGDDNNGGGEGGDLDNTAIPAGKADSIRNNTSGTIADPHTKPFDPLNRIKDDRVRDGSGNEEDDDGEDNGGRQSSVKKQ